MARLFDLLEERVAYRARVRAWLDSPLVGGPRWAAVIGSLVGACFLVLATTGVLLMTVYAPSPQTAWSSVVYLNDELPGGWLLRGLHFAASDAMIVLAAAHVGKLVVTAGYRKPREVYFWLALALLGVVLASAITGHALPWDQRGWWARKVELNIVALGPGGAFLQSLVQGGSDLGALALARFHALHVAILPALFLVLWLVRRHIVRAVPPPATAGKDAVQTGQASQIARDLVGLVVLVLVLVALAYRAHGAPLDAPADPSSDYPARPEWFLLPMYQLRKYFQGTGQFWGTVGLPGLVGLYVFALPFMDKRAKLTAPIRVALLAPLALVGIAGGLLQSAAARHDAGDVAYQKQRAKADQQAKDAIALAHAGVPPQGPLYMLAHDPELRGAALFEKSCASCHVLGDLGDPKKATASRLDGWGTEAWIAKMIHAPDADEYFGRTPYKGEMPSVDAPTDHEAMIKGTPAEVDAQIAAVALFLSAQGDEPGERGKDRPVDEAKRAAGEKIVKETCTDCHTFGGDGDVGGGAEAPELSGYGNIAWTTAQIANPATAATYRDHAGDAHTKGLMPRMDGDLSPADVALLARWTRAKSRGVPLIAP